MSRIPNQTLRRTLGFFRQGIPVLFIKNDAMFRSLNLPDDYSKLLDEDGRAIPGLAFGDDEVAAFERFATILHELRHFHDALLCRPLFDKFLLQHKITWYTLQLINRLARIAIYRDKSQIPYGIAIPALRPSRGYFWTPDADLHTNGIRSLKPHL